jgi:Kef-type K+ transport system membrane component KefB
MVPTKHAMRRTAPSPALLPGLVAGLILFHLMPAALAQAPHGPADGGGAGAHADLVKQLLVGLVLILLGAKLAGELFERVGQPAVLGELLVGIAIGNVSLLGFHQLEFLRSAEAITFLSELGVIVLLFEVGLESNLEEMRRLGWSSLLVATLGVIVPIALGYGVARIFLPKEPWLIHLFVGTTLCATSVGITARVLRDLGQLKRPEAQIVLGAAVIDDVMGLVVLAVVSGIVTSTSGGAPLEAWGVGLIVGKAVAFLVGALVVGRLVSARLFRLASFLYVQHMLLVTSLAVCFLLAALAAQIGLAPIVGAFAAGLILDPVHYQDFVERGEHKIEELVRPIGAFLVPVFFVLAGMNVDLRALGDPSILLFAVTLILVAIVGKQVCAFGVLEKGLNRLAVGLGMIPRGEVGLIFASIGRTLLIPGQSGPEPVVSPATFSAVVLMVMATTLITPPLLKWGFARK